MRFKIIGHGYIRKSAAGSTAGTSLCRNTGLFFAAGEEGASYFFYWGSIYWHVLLKNSLRKYGPIFAAGEEGAS